MNARGCFQRIMSYRSAERLPLLITDPYESLTLDLWRGQGLPAGVGCEEFLGLDTFPSFWVNFFPIPPFEHRVLHEDDREIVETDAMGCTIRRLKEAPDMYYGHVDHPVKSADDWRRYKERLVPDCDARIGPSVQGAIDALAKAATPAGSTLWPFFFRMGFYLMGMERFMTAFYDMPEVIHDIFGHYSQMALTLLEPLLAGCRLDFVSFAEDLAYRNGPHISPDIYRRFWLPHQDPIVRRVRDAGVPVVSMYSSGNFEALLPLMMEHGINCTWPCERNAGMDPLILRKRYGRSLLLAGGVGHKCLADVPAAIDREIDRLTPLIAEGGFIPVIDDMVPPEVPFANYRYCIERLRSIPAEAICRSSD